MVWPSPVVQEDPRVWPVVHGISRSFAILAPCFRKIRGADQLFTESVSHLIAVQACHSCAQIHWQNRLFGVCLNNLATHQEKNNWTFQKAANRLACNMMGEAENCLSEISSADDLDDYKLQIRILKAGFCPDDQTAHFHLEFRA